MNNTKYKYITSYLENKYFMSLGNYDVSQSSHKRQFYPISQDSPFFYNNLLNILNSLSYNLNYDSTNYRYGKRYFSNDLRDFTWVTSNENKAIPQLYRDKKYGTLDYWDKPAKFTKDEILSHFLSYKAPNRLISFFYTSKDKEALINDYSESGKNIYKVHNKTFGSSQQMNSDILLLDIDNRENISAIETLGLFLDYFNINTKELIYIEQNIFTGGIHTALKLPCKISNINFYSELESFLHKEGIDIECNFINKVLRFPLSYEYNPIQKDDKIFQFNEFIPESFFVKSFEEFISDISNPKICSSLELLNFINNFQDIDRKNNYWKIKKHLFKKKYSTGKFKPDYYKIYKGNRYDTMSKLIPYAKNYGNNIEQVADIILANNVSSKDLNKWSREKLIANITPFYNKCKTFDKTIKSYNGFISNEKLLHTKTINFLNNEIFINWFTNKFVQEYMKLRNKHNNGFSNISSMKLENLKKQLPLFLTEIIGSMYYQVNNENEFIDSRFNCIKGFQLSDSHLKAMQDYINQKLSIENELKNTSIQYLKKAILNTLNIEEIYYNRKRNWMNGCCRSYRIKRVNDIHLLLDNLYNRCFQYISRLWITNLDKKDFNIIILYILLVENIGLSYVENNNLYKKLLDIDD